MAATSSELTGPAAKILLTPDEIDRLTALLSKSEGLADLLVFAGERNQAVEPKTLSMSAWTLRDMLTEVRTILEV